MNLQFDAITYIFFKNNVMLFELKEIMMKKYTIFVSIFNRIITCLQTYNEIDYLNKHFYRYPTTFPYLFYINKDVEQHKKNIINFAIR